MTDLTTKASAAGAAEAAALRWRQGDQSAVRDVWDLCGGRMLRLARAIVRSQAAAEDAVQEAFLRAWRAIGRYDPARPFEPWLSAIVVHECRRVLAREARQRKIPHPPLMGRGEASALFEAVEDLPPKLREVVALHHLMGFPVRECARLLRVPEGTVKSRLFRARAALAAQGFGGNRHG